MEIGENLINQNHVHDPNKISILIVDDHEVVRRGLTLVLQQEPDFYVIGDAQDGLEAIAKVKDLKPNVILMDWKMPNMDGIHAAKEIRSQSNTSRILMLSGATVDVAILDTLDQGIDGFINKDISPEILAHAIRTIHEGKPYLGPEISQALITQSKKPTKEVSKDIPKLSSREFQVLELMASPATYRQIGNELYISEETVRTYVKRILVKLNQPNRTQAVIAAIRIGIIKIDQE